MDRYATASETLNNLSKDIEISLNNTQLNTTVPAQFKSFEEYRTEIGCEEGLQPSGYGCGKYLFEHLSFIWLRMLLVDFF